MDKQQQQEQHPPQDTYGDLVDVHAVQLRDAVHRVCTDHELYHDPARTLRRLITSWWRTTRLAGPNAASAVALAASIEQAHGLVGSLMAPTTTQLTQDVLVAGDCTRYAAIERLLGAIGIDPSATTWDEAAADWADMAAECAPMTSAETAQHLTIHTRWALAIVADGDTPSGARATVVDACLTGIAAVADQRTEGGDQRWAGLTHAAVVLDGQDTVARCADLVHVIDDLATLAGGLR